MKNPFEDMQNPLTPERLEKLRTAKDATLSASWAATKAVAKYGTVFVSGVCIGTLAGVALFFYIDSK